MARALGLHLRVVRTKAQGDDADDDSPAVTPPADADCLVLAPTANANQSVTRSYLVRFDFADGETCDVEEWVHNAEAGDATPWGLAPVSTLLSVVPGKLYVGSALGDAKVYHRVVNRTDDSELTERAEEIG
jgi:hypothetical protein